MGLMRVIYFRNIVPSIPMRAFEAARGFDQQQRRSSRQLDTHLQWSYTSFDFEPDLPPD